MGMKIQLSKILPYLICILLGILLWKSCDDLNNRKKEILQAKIENSELQNQISKLEEDNTFLLDSIDKNQIKSDSLEMVIASAKKAKIKLVEKVKYIKVENDTIKDLMLLNEENDRIIDGLDSLLEVKNKIILNQKIVIDNYDKMMKDFQVELYAKEVELAKYQKELVGESRKKAIWKTIALVSLGALTITSL